jgi:hypothetical protein
VVEERVEDARVEVGAGARRVVAVGLPQVMKSSGRAPIARTRDVRSRADGSMYTARTSGPLSVMPLCSCSTTSFQRTLVSSPATVSFSVSCASV